MMDELNQFSKRLIADALLKALPSTWLHRARILEDARPKLGDYNGRATPEEIAARDARLAEQAELCRIHAQLLTENISELRAELNAIVAEILDGDSQQGAAA